MLYRRSALRRARGYRARYRTATGSERVKDSIMNKSVPDPFRQSCALIPLATARGPVTTL